MPSVNLSVASKLLALLFLTVVPRRLPVADMRTTVCITCFTLPLMCRWCTGMCLRRSTHQRSASSKKCSMLSKGTRGRRTSSKLTVLSKLSLHQHTNLHETCYDSNKLQSTLADPVRCACRLLSALHPHPVVKRSLVGLQSLREFIRLLMPEICCPAAPCPCARPRISLLAITQAHVQGAT